MSAPVLRPAILSDRRGVLALFSAHLSALGYASDEELDRDMAEFPASYADGAFIVAELDGELIAMGGVRSGEVRRIYVAPGHRGSGIAQRIVAELVLRSSAPPFAIVARGNGPAERLFGACGFVGTKRSPSHPKMKHCEIWEKRCSS
jgi:GNAT superfamily N-acetyltransferase